MGLYNDKDRFNEVLRVLICEKNTGRFNVTDHEINLLSQFHN